jgi:amino acid adenylation domain-containing protein
VFPYRRYPYASIHKAQAGADLFTTVFNYTHFHRLRELLALPGIEPIGGCGFGQRHYALSAEFNQDPYTNHLRLDLECNLRAADVEHWNRVAQAYQTTLEAIATDTMEYYDRLGIARVPADRRPASACPEMHPTVVEQWSRQVELRPNTVAVIDSRRKVTYAQLADTARAIAERLRVAGTGAEDCVAIYLEAGIEQIAAVWGVLSAGAAYVIVETTLPQSRILHILNDARARTLISTKKLREGFEPSAHRLQPLRWFDVNESSPIAGAPLKAVEIHPEQLAYVTYTSGSTGAPKGVRVSHRTLAYSTVVRKAYYADPVGRFLLIPSFAHDSAVAVVYWTLCAGGTLVVPSHSEVRDPDRLCRLIEEEKITHWLSVPALYETVMQRLSATALESLHCAIVAGEACPGGLAAVSKTRCAADLFNEYGPSEATVWATVYKAEESPVGSTLSIGKAIDGTRVYVLDYHLRPVPPGVTGQIYIGGDGVTRGYAVAAATAERFLPDPFAERPGARMYRTGDLARLQSTGELEFMGRIDRQVKVRGYRVEPAEVEHAVRRIPGVREVAVVPVEMADDGGLRLVAYVVAENSRLQISDLRRACTLSLPAALVPGNFVLLDELPRSENGKVDALYLSKFRPGLIDADTTDRVLARVEAMSVSEVSHLLHEYATLRA